MLCVVAEEKRPRLSRQERPSWAQAIRMRRLTLGLTQEEVAANTDDVISQATISDVERGKVKPTALSYERLSAMIKALNWTEEDFKNATKLNIFSEKDFKDSPDNLSSKKKIRTLEVVSLLALDNLITEVREVPKAFLGGYTADDCRYLTVTNQTLADEAMRDMLRVGDDLYIYKGNAPIEGKPAVYACNGEFSIVQFDMQEKESVKSFDGQALAIVELKNCDLVGRIIGHYRAF